MSNDERVLTARRKVQSAFQLFQTNQCEDNLASLQTQKKKLEAAYNSVYTEVLEEKITRVERADVEFRHAQSWKLINEITGRTAAKKGLIQGDSREDRVKRWLRTL